MREDIPADCPPAFRDRLLACWHVGAKGRPVRETLVKELTSLAHEFHPEPMLITTCEQLETLIHPKRQAGLAYIAPYVTADRVDEPIEMYWARWESKKTTSSTKKTHHQTK